MTFSNTNLATITITEKEVKALRESAEFIAKLKRVLDLQHTTRIIRADTNEVIEVGELLRVKGILTGFNEQSTYWKQEEDEEE